MRDRCATGVCALVLVLLSVVPALACFDVDSPPTATIRFTSPTSAELIVSGLVVKAGGLNAGDYCAAGLGYSNVILTVGAPTVVDAADDPPTPAPEYAFSANATTLADIAALTPGPTWSGFHSALTGPVAAGDPADLAFTITFPGGTTYTDLETELAANGLVTTDDATAGGNLAGTTQHVEAISALSELPDCYNDVLDAGEVCDAASNLGCTPGNVCAQCSQCVAQNLPNKCKSTTLTSIANTDKSRLKCYAKAAKAGLSVDPNCLTNYQQLITIAWFKLGANLLSCPLFPSYPTSTAVDNLVDGLNGNLATAFTLGGTSGAWKCASNKFKAASLRAVNTLKCWAKAYQHNTSVDPNCLTKVDLKYNQAFARAEAPLQCDPGNVGNAGSVATLVDDFVTDGTNGVVDLIPPP